MNASRKFKTTGTTMKAIQLTALLTGFLFAAVLSTLTFVEYQKLLPDHFRSGRKDFLKSVFYNWQFDIFLWRPNLLDFFDEILGKKKSWLT